MSAISGAVRDAHGQLVPGAIVRVVPAEAGPEAAPYLGVTDASGRFAVGVPSGATYNVVAESQALSQTAVRYHVLSGTTTADIDLTPTSTISGTLSLPGGASAVGALVFIAGTSYLAAPKSDGSSLIVAGRTNTSARKATSMVSASSVPNHAVGLYSESDSTPNARLLITAVVSDARPSCSVARVIASSVDFPFFVSRRYRLMK